MEKHEFVIAEKNGVINRFSKKSWDLLPADKCGWCSIDEAPADPLTPKEVKDFIGKSVVEDKPKVELPDTDNKDTSNVLPDIEITESTKKKYTKSQLDKLTCKEIAKKTGVPYKTATKKADYIKDILS